MLTGQALGDALAVAIEKKGVSKADVARAFGIKGPSVYDWINHGRIGKQHLGKLVAYFADVVEPSHWGITDATPFPTPVAESATTDSNSDILSSLQDALVAADEATRKAAADLLSRYAEAPDNESIANALRALLRRPQ